MLEDIFGGFVTLFSDDYAIWFVILAAFVGIVFLCFCYRKQAKALSRKELDRDEEADQLAAGD